MRKIVRALLKQDALHNGLVMSRDASNVQDWETSEGGGVRAVGVGGGVTGMGANLIVIDDPVKSRKEADSGVYRDTAWDWYCEDLRTRLEPGGAIIVIMTRWHEDDLVGRLLKDAKSGGEQWTVINLPALAEEDDALGRKPGEALCPERYDVAALESLKRVLKNAFFALFQQRPQPAEGSFFKRQWFDRVIEADAVPKNLEWVRYWDLAVSTKTGADNTASAAVALDKDGTLYIRDMICGQWEWPDAKKNIVATMLNEPKVRVGIEKALHGLAAVQELRRVREITHIAFAGIDVDGDKKSRAMAWQDRAEDGKVVLVQGPWINNFLIEVTAFPSGAHDDQVDTISGGIAMLSRSKSKKMRSR
jgi:predicted phage terminase large subunit-like protein